MRSPASSFRRVARWPRRSASNGAPITSAGPAIRSTRPTISSTSPNRPTMIWWRSTSRRTIRRSGCRWPTRKSSRATSSAASAASRSSTPMATTAQHIADNRDKYPLLSRLPLWYARYKPEIGMHFPEGQLAGLCAVAILLAGQLQRPPLPLQGRRRADRHRRQCCPDERRRRCAGAGRSAAWSTSRSNRLPPYRCRSPAATASTDPSSSPMRRWRKARPARHLQPLSKPAPKPPPGLAR